MPTRDRTPEVRHSQHSSLRTLVAVRRGARRPARQSRQRSGISRIDSAAGVSTPSSVYLSPPWMMPWAQTVWPAPSSPASSRTTR